MDNYKRMSRHPFSIVKGEIMYMLRSFENVTRSRLQRPSLNMSDIQWNREHRTITIEDITITLTPTQYRLLLPLQYGVPVTYAKLAQIAYNCPVDGKVRMMMDKQIDRIRGKLRGTGLYIYCILSYGYILFDEVSVGEEEQTDS
jgi:DNA-binding response OmpR family regulator